MSTLLASTVDITILLAIALGLTTVLRRRSAALRHAILAAAIAAGAAAPLLEATMPPWRLAIFTPAAVASSPVRFGSAAAVAGDTLAAAAAAPEPFDWTGLMLGTWLAGAVVGLGGLLFGLVRLHRLTSACTRITHGRWRDTTDALLGNTALRDVTVLQSREPSLVVTCGVIRPKIVLPAGADGWSDTCRRIVLAHELAHIRRFDWATHILGEALRAIYWFHPLVWIASRRLRHESECACDDVVIARGIDATDYATHLLQIAREAVRHRTPWAAAPAIAHPTTLERRISAMLKDDRRREPLTRRTAAAVVGAAVALTLPVTAMSTGARHEDISERTIRPDVSLLPPPAAERAPVAARPERRAEAPAAPQEKPATISGTLYDQLGGLLPGVALTLTDQRGGVAFVSTTDRDGTFAFVELQPSTYELIAVLPGFAPVSTVMPIGPGGTIERRITMPIGSLQETITVGCERAAQPAASRPRPVVREPRVLQSGSRRNVPVSTGASPFNGGIGGQIAAPRQIAKANPVCPNHVGVDTVVILAARVGIDGYLSDIRLMNQASEPAPEIVDSAMEAVRLWQYTPTLLNGVPVEANIMMTVAYEW